MSATTRAAAVLTGLALWLSGCAPSTDSGPRDTGSMAAADRPGDARGASAPRAGSRDGTSGSMATRREGDSVTQSLAFPTGDRGTSVILLEKVFPAQARLGQPYRYELRVTNLTDHPLSGVVVRERFPESFRAGQADAGKPAEAAPAVAVAAAAAVPAAAPATPPDERPPSELRVAPSPVPSRLSSTQPAAPAAPGTAARLTEPTTPGGPTTRRIGAEPPPAPAAAPAAPAAPASDTDPAAPRAADTPPAGAGAPGEGQAYVVGELGPRQTKTIPVSGVADRIGRLDTCTSVTYTPVLCAGTEVINPILQLAREAPADADLCQDILVRYVVSNVGTGTETNVRIEEKLPEGLRPAADPSVDTVSIPVGELGEGKSRSFSVKLRAKGVGKYTGRAVARGMGTEAPSQETPTQVRAPKLDVKLTGPESEYVGKAATYDVVVTNTGDAAARDVQLQSAADNAAQIAWFAAAGDQPPGFAPGAAVPAAAPRAGARDRDTAASQGLGTIEPGQAKKARVAVRPTSGGAVNVAVTAKAYCAEDVTARAKTNVLTIAALLLEVTDREDPVRVGESTLYSITVKNQGTGADSNVRVVATLPEQLTPVKSGGPTAGTNEGQKVTFAPLPRLAPGESVTWTVEARAVGAGDVRFKIEMTSDSLTQPVLETESTKLY